MTEEDITLPATDGANKSKSIKAKTKLELKWVHQTRGPVGTKRFLKCTCGNNVYTFEEAQSVNMVAVADPCLYTIHQISRFALLPTVIKFTAKEKGRLKFKGASQQKSLAHALLKHPLKLICFETLDIGVAIVGGDYNNINEAAIIPKGAGNQKIVIQHNDSSDVYANAVLSPNRLSFIRNELYFVSICDPKPIWISRKAKKRGEIDVLNV